MHEERTARLRDFDNQLDRVRNELEYLRSENKDRKAKTETEKVSTSFQIFCFLLLYVVLKYITRVHHLYK